MHRTIGTLLAVIALLAASAGVAAAMVQHDVFHDRTFTVIDSSCGYDIAITTHATSTETTFYDRAGEPIRFTIHTATVVTLENVATGETLRDPYYYTFIDNFDGTVVYVGANFQVHQKGQPPIVMDVGKLVFDETGIVFEAGPHDIADGASYDVCVLLAP